MIYMVLSVYQINYVQKKNEHYYLHQIHISAPKYATFKKDIEKDLSFV